MAVIEQVQKDIWTGRIVAVEDVHLVRQFRCIEQGIISKHTRKAGGEILVKGVDVKRTMPVGDGNLTMLLEMKVGILAAIHEMPRKPREQHVRHRESDAPARQGKQHLRMRQTYKNAHVPRGFDSFPDIGFIHSLRMGPDQNNGVGAKPGQSGGDDLEGWLHRTG